ncbi:amidohydrolase family protein [Nocardiopsis sp. CNT312]|uniref:amidohydrolase family protein n=1 Tax=Nocardiopsis sp. CNT312 TaxID=1137268 RepID=UPI00048CC0B4|nr:amidohydrolase family protein [Nocardiopsis sp. CNT312]
MAEFDSVIRSRRVVTPEGSGPRAVGIRDGRIEAVAGYDAAMPARTATDLGDTALLPGGVDVGTGVHRPGEDLAESYRAVGRAALRGGVTSVVASAAPARPAVDRVGALGAHRRAAAGTAVSVSFLGGVGAGSGSLDLTDLLAEGVTAFQCSLSDGGEPDLSALDDSALRRVMAELAAVDAVLLVHAEDSGELGSPPVGAGRPPRAERRGLERVLAAARMAGARTHVHPFTAAECAALLAAAGAVGVELTAQTCPHYLCLPAESLVPASPAHACRPPLRSEANRAALWSALVDPAGPAVTTVGSGHLPAHGLYTLEWSLSALWTAARRRRLGLEDVVRWTAQGPADLLGLPDKGRIGVGADADLVAFDSARPVAVPTGDPSPYAGRELAGAVGPVWIAGHRVRPE